MKRRSVTDYWPAAAKVMEFDPRDGGVREELTAAGFRYLGVVGSKQRLQRIVSRQPTWSSQFVALPASQGIRSNNADVLILQGGAAAKLGRYRNVRHAKHIACPLNNGPVLLWTLLFWLGHFLLGRLAWPRLVRVGETRLLSFRMRRPKPYESTRRFIPHATGVDGFFTQLKSAGVRHAVLRWFENLPQVALGEDLDLLVDDSDLEKVRSLLDAGPGMQAVDLYSVCGAPGADYRKLPYYPPYLAEQLLAGSVCHRDLCNVPSPRDHFLSLAYHAVYQKGHASGLPFDNESHPVVSRPEHDYASILAAMATRLGIDISTTIRDLDQYLDAQGWRPPHDMLVRLARKNRSLRSLVEQSGSEDTDTGLAVFLLRREALARGGVKRAAKLIAEHGFEIVETISFAPERIPSIARSLRGGNWGPGPWPTSGGEPVAAIVVHDPAPIRPTRRERRKFPFLANARLLKKDAIRDAFNANRPASEHCNAIHSSDNGRECRDYLRIIAPERAAEILERVAALSEPRRRAA